MKYQSLLLLICLLCLRSASMEAQNAQRINLIKAVHKHKIEVLNRELTFIDEGTYQGIRLSKDYGEGLAWMKGIDFSEGTIEFDVRGENVKQHSFVGIAFHGQNDSTYDAIYLRPFHFLTQDTILKKRMIQYISLPTYTWQKLRAESPDQYEAAIAQSLDPNGWVHVRIVVKGKTITTYINDEKNPTLVVTKVTSTNHGRIGFYVADTSGGDFANVVVQCD